MIRDLPGQQRAMKTRQNAIRAAQMKQYRDLVRSRFMHEFFRLCRKHKFSSRQAREWRMRMIFGPAIREALQDVRVLQVLKDHPCSPFLNRP